jgi:UDP-glucose 4-epimerase
MKVMVTGGSGFIGSHVLDKLVAAGHEAVNFDLVRSPHHNGEVSWAEGSLLDPAQVRAGMRGCDAVIHLAAWADVDQVIKDPASAEDVNVRGTRVILDAARAEGVPRVVYGSTVWAYDKAVGAEPYDEDTPLGLPSHFYTATKLAGEMYCRSYGDLYGQEHTILRFGIPYGPRSRPTAVVAAFTAKALRGEPLTIAGDGSQSRRFVYVEDLAEGVVAGLAPQAANRIYNLVSSDSVTIREVAETVQEIVGEVDVVSVEGRKGDLAPAEISGARAADELGWRPETPFAEGVRRYVEWVRASSEARTNASPVA